MSDIASDLELTLFLKKHIENPCINYITGLNIRDFYIREAENLIEDFVDINAKEILRLTIDKYSSKI